MNVILVFSQFKSTRQECIFEDKININSSDGTKG